MRAPLADGVVAHVGGVAQELDRVQEGVLGGVRGSDGVDQEQASAGPENARGLANRRLGARVVVGGQPRGHDVEGAVREGQLRRVALPEADVREAPLLRHAPALGEHLGGEVERLDLGPARREGQRRVARPAPEIEDLLAALEVRRGQHRVQVRPAGVNGAGGVPLRGGSEDLPYRGPAIHGRFLLLAFR